MILLYVPFWHHPPRMENARDSAFASQLKNKPLGKFQWLTICEDANVSVGNLGCHGLKIGLPPKLDGLSSLSLLKWQFEGISWYITYPHTLGKLT